ncbi:bifunctional 4-hydroxy-2-oxoglutarate aldolase/2-dehydro-3-deoxy-phosphogluconate aldolase [Sporolactobacillus sp. CQH2019]|uniref:bifunctional 4-hydroxy-2-oxoglutarate aldolase/2-dehydro-3-deoxy-phosphogluconate aldolase n=1 Tax=Sporolactobacillus sp. CQH2019 TaxID=3023512 RepID=UPI0023680B88|nr:bifunctional 4-hydroxy-2-oxoglutarate aldolase/2-dehydro-3-deoxy-phosphogluconate aldolase [Sporolactobacillus sp. CQH2019]MDD9147751.1 bifunctional 4-hydroxy-2-oxoglutarate aldolase/2-dehydro-3-deoxy-phosphogluconate aldolase [Sporolactobacillus sp. CQH2019]
MQKIAVLTALEKNGIVAVLRAESAEKALKIADALVAGGVKSIELTFTVPGAVQAIENLAKEYADDGGVVIGAGTVLDAHAAHDAITAGAKFVVAPTFDRETAELCNLYQIPYIPGCMTVNEMKTAMKAGSDLVKFFPSDVLGPAFIKDVKAPLPQLEIMPSGGVNLDNLADWYQAGCKVIGVGGSLLKPAKTNQFDKVTETAKAFAQRYRQLSGRHA